MKKKILVACLCVALAMLTIAGTTLAYLTSQDKVENTFTVGKVAITLDEAKVDNLGNPLNEAGKPVDNVKAAHRQKANSYKLMPGHTYVKDPTVHVTAGSEKCYVFVKVENGIANLESKAAGYKSIATQITDNKWLSVSGETGVYYQIVDASTSEKNIDLTVFSSFTLADDANSHTDWSKSDIKVNVTAYAVQYDGFDNNLAGAWNAAKAAANTTTPTT